ncbi:MAG: polysaccharide biosynthesis protein [Burkholderiales bacterium]|nr:polysaccharide biosynthesis protein [Burkholderiales bacterium]
MKINLIENHFLNKIVTSYKHLLNQLHKPSILALLLLDSILLPLALLTSVLLRLGGSWDHHLSNSLWLFVALPVWTIPIFISLGLYNAVIKYIDEKIVIIVLLGVSFSVLILVIVTRIAQVYAFPITSIIIFWIFALAYIGGTRIFLRGISRTINNKQQNKNNIAIYGAGSAGVQLCLSLRAGNEYHPVVFFDDDKKKWGSSIKGITVIRPRDIAKILRKYNIEQVLLAIPSSTITRRNQIVNLLEPFEVKIKTIPGIADLISGEVTINDIKEIDIEDLLGREQIPADTLLLEKNIKNKSVIITGAGGSIGSELSRQIAQIQPSVMVLFDISEYALYKIDRELRAKYPELKIIDILGNVTDYKLVDRVIKQYLVNTIYHAAAYKHVPIVEFNPISGINNNVIGTYIVAQSALKNNVDIMVLISTDKAVRPTNIMGASKRLAELTLQSLQETTTRTVFTMVRFGNVLGSSGSVVPLFREQIKAGGPVTVTHPDIIRYFMTIPEAVQLVIQASNMANGGEVFILDMGQPVKIVDLARRMIHLSGFSIQDDQNQDGDIEIKYTGLRPGEKLYEELLIDNNPQLTSHSRVMRGNEVFIPYIEMQKHLDDITEAINNFDNKTIVNILKKIVRDYTASNTVSYID